MKDFRRERRQEAGDSARATILGHPDVTAACVIQDFSPSGMCILSKQEIARGQIVKIDWETHFLVGRVRTVSVVASGFRVGIELLLCSRWCGTKTLVPSDVAAPLEIASRA